LKDIFNILYLVFCIQE